jgi:hypothetical protein
MKTSYINTYFLSALITGVAAICSRAIVARGNVVGVANAIQVTGFVVEPASVPCHECHHIM